ncbi:MAG: hypothetical protein QOJ40_1267 [Verrucomicrobiota bacterium]
MFIVTTAPDALASSVGAAWMGVLALRAVSSERESMPLLRSLPDRAAPVAINMALLTELLPPPIQPLRCFNAMRNEQATVPHPASCNS